MSIWLILLQFVFVSCNDESAFIATSEWTEIKEGQSIRQGLHVRMDLSTGKKEAKIIDPEEEASVNTHQLVAKTGENEINVNTMEEELKNVVNSSDSAETLSQKFRSIDDLKKSLGDINLDIKSEAEELKSKIKQLTKLSNTEIASLVIVLEDLEDLAHKYDNGKLLASEGWMLKVGQLLDHQNDNVYKGALRVISAASQSNPSVQAYCINHGYLGTLISKIMTQSDKLAKSTIFTISAILRNLPAGIDTFANLQGFGTLTMKLNLSSFPPLHKVVLTLFNDMFLLHKQLGLGEDKILQHFAKAICKKTKDLITQDSTDLDVFEESVVLYSHIQSLCGSDHTQVIKGRLDNYSTKNEDSNIIGVIKDILN